MENPLDRGAVRSCLPPQAGMKSYFPNLSQGLSEGQLQLWAFRWRFA